MSYAEEIARHVEQEFLAAAGWLTTLSNIVEALHGEGAGEFTGLDARRSALKRLAILRSEIEALTRRSLS